MESKITRIGWIRSPFREKFGVPKQSLMIQSARGLIQFHPPYGKKEAFQGLEGFTHLWILFQFHERKSEAARLTTAPPAIDGPASVGVFASRSPYHPNGLGMSVVKIETIRENLKTAEIEIEVSGVDLLDETPIFDIKPYVPFVDQVANAKGAWTDQANPIYKVNFSDESLQFLKHYETTLENKTLFQLDVKKLVEEVLSLDPRPLSQKKAHPLEDERSESQLFAFRLLDFDVKWRPKNKGIWLETIVKI